MISIIGDIHGELEKIYRVITKNIGNIKDKEETFYIIVLGDAGLNFYLNNSDVRVKTFLQRYIESIKEDFEVDVHVLFVRGNHDCPPRLINTYNLVDYHGGKVFVEYKYPNLLFLRDGDIYSIDGKDFLCVGGGNSADYFSRILNNYPFFNEEGLNIEEKDRTQKNMKLVEDGFFILSHMLPRRASPNSSSLPLATESVEEFLDLIHENVKDKKIMWFAGHYHKDAQYKLDNIVFHLFFNKSINL